MSDHDDFLGPPDDGDVADWVADEVDAAWDDDVAVPDDAGDQAEWVDDDSVVLDDDLDVDVDRGDPDVPTGDDDASSPTIDLPLGDDDLDAVPATDEDILGIELADPTADDGDVATAMAPGFFGAESVTDLATWLAPDVDADALREAIAGFAGDDAGVDARATVQLLDGAGVDAHVTHGTLDDLADALEAGGRVVIAGGDGERYDVVAVDFRADVLVVESDAGARSIPLETFEDAWSDGAFEMVVASGDEAGLTLLPMSLDTPDPGR